MPAPESLAHRPYEDVQGLLTGTLFIALGTLMFSQAKLLTGGTAGIALLISYLTGWPFGPVFFAVNLPFYLFAWKQMGKGFTLRTAAAVSLMSLFAWALPWGLAFERLSPTLAAGRGGGGVGAGDRAAFFFVPVRGGGGGVGGGIRHSGAPRKSDENSGCRGDRPALKQNLTVSRLRLDEHSTYSKRANVSSPH